MWQLAGILGIDPGPFTLRELIAMAEARSQQAWAHTSSILALIANLHRDPKRTRAYKPGDFNPHMRRKPATVQRVGISVLKQVFVENRQQGT